MFFYVILTAAIAWILALIVAVFLLKMTRERTDEVYLGISELLAERAAYEPSHFQKVERRVARRLDTLLAEERVLLRMVRFLSLGLAEKGVK